MSPASLRRSARMFPVALCSLLSACYTTIGKWTYPSGRYPTTECARPAPAVVAVEPFVDLRSETNKSWMTWWYVPLFPYGWKHFDRPEATVFGEDTVSYWTTPCQDLPRSIADELSRQRLVERADFTDDRRRDLGHTHVLTGKLRAFYVHESRWSYGLSIYCVALYALGLPMGYSDNGFCVELELRDAKDGRVVWKGSVFDADHWIEGYYYGPEWYRFSWMWERRLREKLGEIARALGTEPAPLPEALREELRQTPPAMPPCLGVDSATPCSVRSGG